MTCTGHHHSAGEVTHTHTCIGWGGFVMNPFDDFKAVLSRYYGDSRDACDEMLQWDTVIHLPLLHNSQRTELCCIAFWETESTETNSQRACVFVCSINLTVCKPNLLSKIQIAFLTKTFSFSVIKKTASKSKFMMFI